MCPFAETVYYSPRRLRNGVGGFVLSSSAQLKKEIGMRRTLLLLFSTAAALLLASGAVLALPSQKPDNTPMVDGRVRAIKQVGTNVWLGGRISQVTRRDGTLLGNVGNLAVLDSQTNKFKPIAPKLGGTDAEVWDIEPYGETGDLLIGGTFAGPNTKKNLVLVDGSTGKVIRWYDAPSLKTVLAAPGLGRVYGGGRSLSAFEFASGKELWRRAKTSVDPTIRTHDSKPTYRDLKRDGRTIWAACICDAVNGNPAKALVKLGIKGNHDASWRTQAGEGAFGESVVKYNGKLYLGAGGSDFVGQYDKAGGGARDWVRDTSGSTQVVALMDGKLVIGGHFYAVGDQGGDRCGVGRPGDVDQKGDPVLNSFGECESRQGIAAYSFGGQLDPNWHPAYSGSYSLVWALHVEGDRLHTGGEFKKVSGVTQTSYARLSPGSP
jgi:hypothetical protein